MKAPVLVQVDLIGTPEDPVRQRLLPALAELAQNEWPLVLLAVRPDRWTPTRNRVDRAFMRQATIEADLRRAGAALDGILYLDFGLFSRQRQRGRDIADLADRYGCKTRDMHGIAQPGRIADTMREVVGSIDIIDGPDQLDGALRALTRR
ncbi:MAG: hypothetical protein RQ847_13035 [Wenzhouxiangellaceae bacterium]|nr:hypothetical protein [Wenzhouxiangellaceae bacterium]